jgi:hypothetical protein
MTISAPRARKVERSVTYPKKGRGKQALRRIVVEGRVFRWRFQAGFEESILTVCGESSSDRPLHIILRGWRDPWLNIAGFVHDDSGALMLSTKAINHPVREAILHGTALGWRPHERGAMLFCVYEGGNWSDLSPRR